MVVVITSAKRVISISITIFELFCCYTVPSIVTSKKQMAAKAKRAKPKKPKTRRKQTKKVGKKWKKTTKKTTKKAKSFRKGPTISALKVPVGTICYGNDGQLWKVKLTVKSQKWVRAKMQAAPHAAYKFRMGPCASKVH